MGYWTGLTTAGVLFLGNLTAQAGELLGPEGITIAVEAKLLTTREVTSAFFNAEPNGHVNYAGRSLRDLDLSGLDFRAAELSGADLFGADLTDANLKGVNFKGGNLNRTIIIRANFAGANLKNATLMRPSVSTSLDYDPRESPSFRGTDMRNITMTAKMIGADFREANLSGGKLGPHEPRADLSSMPSSILKSCDFSGAIMTDIDLSRAVLVFSRFVGADLRGARLDLADLSKADLSGADLTGADMTNANLDEANLTGAKGFDTVRGRDTIKNLDRVRR